MDAVYPDLSSRDMEVSVEQVNRYIGVSLEAEQVWRRAAGNVCLCHEIGCYCSPLKSRAMCMLGVAIQHATVPLADSSATKPDGAGCKAHCRQQRSACAGASHPQ